MLFTIAAESATPTANRLSGLTMGKVIAAIWMLLWSLVTLTLDVTVLVLVVQAMLAWSYPVASGTITQSEVRHEAGENRDREVVDVKYQFHVSERDFTGSRVQFFSVLRSRPQEVVRLVKSLPVGQPVEVFYNPSQPSDCALDRALDGQPLFLGLLLLPFNLAMVGSWRFAVRMHRGIRNSRIKREGDRWIVRRSQGDPFAVALIVAGTINVVAIFFLSSTNLSASVGIMSLVWLTLVGLTSLAYWQTSSAVRNDLPILMADNVARTLIWPSTSTSNSEQTIPVTQLCAVEFEEVLTPTSNGKNALSYSVAVKFVADEDQVMTRLVLQTTNGNEAETLADFLDDWTGHNRT